MTYYINSKDEARRWDYVCRVKRGFVSLEEPDFIDYVAELVVRKWVYKEKISKRPIDNLVIDHIIPLRAVLDPRLWDHYSLSEKKEWIAFINEWEKLGRRADGSFWIASGLQCKANLQLLTKRQNVIKNNYFDSLGL